MIRQTMKVATLWGMGLAIPACLFAQDPINNNAGGPPGLGQYEPVGGNPFNLVFTNPTGNTLNTGGGPAEFNLIGGNNNTIDAGSGGAFANLAYGLDNQIFESNGSIGYGRANVIGASNFAYAFGLDNQLDEANNSATIGEANEIISSEFSLASGGGNNIEDSEGSAVLGETNGLSSSSYSIATGIDNMINSSDASTTMGFENEINNGEGSMALGSMINLSGNQTHGYGDNIEVSSSRAMALGFGEAGGSPLPGLGSSQTITLGIEGGNVLNIFNNGTQRVAAIGTNTVGPNFKFRVNGNIKCQGISTVSDRALKTDVKALKSPLERIQKLRGLTYKFDQSKDPDLNLSEGKEIGFIAQEVEEVFPSLVTSPEDGWSSINYQAMVPVLTEGLKKQQEQIEQQRNEIDNLKARVRQLEAQVKSENRNAGSDLSQNNGRNKLENNAPNPFNQKTTIGYQVGNGQDARINVYNMNGRQLESYQVESGQGELTISANTFKAGMYMYNLMVDGEVVSTKRMVITANQ